MCSVLSSSTLSIYILSISPLCGLSGTEMIPHSAESKHSPLWAFKLCLFSELYVWVQQRWPPHPFPTNSTTNDSPALASIQCTAWENTTALEKEGRTTNQECGQSPVSLATPPVCILPLKISCHIAYINLYSHSISSCEADGSKMGFSGASRLFEGTRWKVFLFTSPALRLWVITWRQRRGKGPLGHNIKAAKAIWDIKQDVPPFRLIESFE